MGVIFLSDMLSRCLEAESKTKDPRLIPEHWDMGMLWPVVRACGLCTLVPSLAYPIGLLHMYAYTRIMATTNFNYRQEFPKYTGSIKYCVYRREYDHLRKRMTDSSLFETQHADEVARALHVVGSLRNEYVMDPQNRSVSYYVIEQRQINGKNIFQGENFAWTCIAEWMRFMGVVLACYMFLPAARRFNTDVVQVLKRQLPVSQVRHPAMNFFFNIQEYNRAKNRLNARLPSDARPWNYKL